MTPNVRLLILTFSPIRSDPRVLKQVELFKDRYEVATCAFGPAPDGVGEHYELPDGAQAWPSDKVGLITRRYGKVYAGLSAVVAARALLPRGRFDIIIANDLNALPLALELEPRLGVHSDLHEFAPREKEDDRMWWLFVAPYQRWLCRKYLPSAASVTTVSDGIAAQYTRDYGVPVGVVTNAAHYVPATPRATGERVRLIYSGVAQRYRRIETVIEAMRSAPEWLSLDLMLMPNEPDYVAELAALAEGLPGVTLRDPVPYRELVATLMEYDAAVVFLPPSTFNLRYALPNKFFEAVQARIGVIVGPSPAMAALVEEHRIGRVTAGFTAEDLSTTLTTLTRDRVAAWKVAADAAAAALSAEAQVRLWDELVGRIAEAGAVTR